MKETILKKIYSTKWLILPEQLQSILAVAKEQGDLEQVAKFIKEKNNQKKAESDKEANLDENKKPFRYSYIENGFGVISLKGSIVRYSNFFTDWCGGTSIEIFKSEFKELLADSQVKTIIIDVDSGGGEVNGISDAADMVFAAREQKEIITVASGTMASAAYWIGAASEQVYCSRTSEVGSVGVVTQFVDDTAKLEGEGIKIITLTSEQSPDKRLDPNNPDDRMKIVQVISDIAEVFITSLARYRDTTYNNIVDNYGRGNVLIGQKSQDQGMIDGIRTISDIMNRRRLMVTLPREYNLKAEEQKMTNPNKTTNADNGTGQAPEPEALKDDKKIDLEKFRKEVIAEEQLRIQAIEEICDDAEILSKAKADSTITKGAVALMMVEKQKEKTKSDLAKKDTEKKKLS